MTNASGIHSARILIVDDCCDTACTLCELLMLSGYKDVAWTSGHNVLATLNIGKAYGLLVLDMNMPGMSGLEVMHSLSKRQTAHRMPVIAISGDRRYETPAIEAGACAFLLKPFNNGEIEATVYHALSTTSGKHR